MIFNDNKNNQNPHSSAYFGDYRDFWWNRNFIELMVRRWQLDQKSSLLDVGCGLGHWVRLLFPYLSSEAKIVGVDREKLWVDQAKEIFAKEYPQVPVERYQFIVGDTYNLPFDDNCFDVVTCQTVIMHLEKPLEGLAEMLRVTKKGGLLICVEPENIFNTLNFSSLTYKYPVETIVKLFEFWLRYEKGKINLGEGNNSIGGLVPGFFSQIGLSDIKVYLSDKASPMFPPYNTQEQLISIEQNKTWYREFKGSWNCEEVKKYYLASGASEKDFNESWNIMKILYKDYNQAISESSLYSGGGGVCYLVSARKP